MRWLLPFLALSACQAPARSASWFAAHPEVAEQVISDCRKGRHRSDECDAASAGAAKQAGDARQQRFRQGFR